MKLVENKYYLIQIQIRYIVYAILALLLMLVELLFIDIIAIESVTPDLLLILCVWITLAEGQFVGLFFAFGIGLIFDVISGDVIGTNALAKLVASYVAGFFHKERNIKSNLNTLRFTLVVLVSAFIHNIIYFFFYLKPAETSFWQFFLQYGVSATLYTMLFSAIAILIKIPAKEIDID
ncbi:MAG TPA: rod shape-determining protein MreD [Candidatus Kapabacteria bacterium]|nr:rod shape-determining protein MreD [Candidatus Kapabacteria bacterium]